MSLKPPTPLRHTPSSAPYEAMAASQQAHIDELIQKNRKLELTHQKLKDELTAEQARAKDAVQQLQAKWVIEQNDWRTGCDALLASHRIVHLRTRVALDKLRQNWLDEQDAVKRERIKCLQRDYRLTVFQGKETELLTRIAELEEELEFFGEERNGDLEEWTQQYSELETELTTTAAQVDELVDEKQHLEVRQNAHYTSFH